FWLGSGGCGDAVVDVAAELSSAGSARGLYVMEAVPLVGVGFIDRRAHEGVVVVDTDLGEVARVIADGDRAPDEGGERGREVALSLEMDAVPLDRAVLGDSQEEAVELLEALGHPRHPPLADPGRLRARSNCSVRALVVLAYELPDGSVQAGQLQGGHGMMMPRGEMPRQG